MAASRPGIRASAGGATVVVVAGALVVVDAGGAVVLVVVDAGGVVVLSFPPQPTRNRLTTMRIASVKNTIFFMFIFTPFIVRATGSIHFRTSITSSALLTFSVSGVTGVWHVDLGAITH
jgi:hypothetical protein